MIADSSVLILAKKETLPNSTDIYQTDDGTVYYWKQSSPQRLYLRSHGKEIDAILPDGKFDNIGIFGNEIYLASDDKIYKASRPHSDKITVDHMRDILEGEVFDSHGLCIRVRDEKQYVYRLRDDPDVGAILTTVTGVSDDKTKGIVHACIHRGKVIHYSYEPGHLCPTVHKTGDNGIIIEASFEQSLAYATESSPFIYLSFLKDQLHILNTDTMEFLPVLEIQGITEIKYVAGVNNEEISVKTKMGDEYYLVTAQMPDGYCLKPEVARKSEEHAKRLIPDGFDSRFLNEFKIENILGVGGFGIVFEVTNTIDSWKYAVKRVSVKPNEEGKPQEEAKTMAKLNHPGIVGYKSTWIEKPPEEWQFDADRIILKRIGPSKRLFKFNYQFDSVFLYIQMELCKDSLDGWLDKNRDSTSRALPRMKSWFKQIVSAVEYIHEMDIIHRDLKPANVLFYQDDWLKVCDLGISAVRNADSGDTNVYRSGIGTEMYMSPEHRGLYGKYSSKTDVFALGLILTELYEWKKKSQLAQIFEKYRNGEASEHIREMNTANFVKMLSHVDPIKRPTCKEMLVHPYFSSEDITLPPVENDRRIKHYKEDITFPPVENKRRMKRYKDLHEETIEYESKFLNEFSVVKLHGDEDVCVFQVVCTIDKSEYAVKRIPVETTYMEPTLNELRTLFQLDHPNIVRYISLWIEQPPERWQIDADAELMKTLPKSEKNLAYYDDDSAFIYLQMQLCNYSLSDWLAENLHPSTREISRMKIWFNQIVSAVDYIHSKNLIHGYIKPSNVLFVEKDILKLSDLGVATNIKNYDPNITREISSNHTYLSPEQYKPMFQLSQSRASANISSKTDVFNLGLILAELCTVMNYEREDLGTMGIRKSRERMEIFNNYRRGKQLELITDESVAAIIKILTKVEPEERPSCSEILDILQSDDVVATIKQWSIARL